MTWYEMIQQRRANKGERFSDQRRDFLAGRRYRRGIGCITDRKSGETSIVAQNGCFGRLATIDRDLYDLWAQGTRGAL